MGESARSTRQLPLITDTFTPIDLIEAKLGLGLYCQFQQPLNWRALGAREDVNAP